MTITLLVSSFPVDVDSMICNIVVTDDLGGLRKYFLEVFQRLSKRHSSST